MYGLMPKSGRDLNNCDSSGKITVLVKSEFTASPMVQFNFD